MPLPDGFKLNGARVKNEKNIPVSPRVKQVMKMLDTLPLGEVLTTRDVAGQLSLSLSGSVWAHPALSPYSAKIENKRYWGSQKSIAKLNSLTEGTHED